MALLLILYIQYILYAHTVVTVRYSFSHSQLEKRSVGKISHNVLCMTDICKTVETGSVLDFPNLPCLCPKTIKLKAEARLDLLRQVGVAVDTWLKSAMNQVCFVVVNVCVCLSFQPDPFSPRNLSGSAFIHSYSITLGACVYFYLFHA